MFSASIAGTIIALLISQSGTDPLSDAAARRKIAVDRIDRLVLDAVQLARSDPEAGRPALENARQAVERETALPEDRRQAHLRLLKAVEGRLTGPNTKTPDALGQPRRLPPSVTGGNTAGSRKPVSPGNPADIARGMIGKNQEALTRQNETRGATAGDRASALRRVEAAASPPGRDLELPADWSEKTARRSPEGRLTNPQKKIVAALNKPITANMESVDLGGFFDWMEKQMDIDILVDRQALETIGVGMQMEIPVKSRGLAARTLMRKVLADLGAAYIVTDEGLQVTSLEVARNTMVTKVHYVGDLVFALNNYQFQPIPAQYNAAFWWYGWDGLALMQQQSLNAQLVNQLQMNQNVQSLIDMVKKTGDPDSWEPVGPGRVTYDPITKSLIVKQSAEYHFKNGP
jgi:hypothetical protein